MSVKKILLIVWELKLLVSRRTRYSKKYPVKKLRSRLRITNPSLYSSGRKSNLRKHNKLSNSSLHSTDLPSMSPTFSSTLITIKTAKCVLTSLLMSLESLCISTKMYPHLLGKYLN